MHMCTYTALRSQSQKGLQFFRGRPPPSTRPPPSASQSGATTTAGGVATSGSGGVSAGATGSTPDTRGHAAAYQPSFEQQRAPPPGYVCHRWYVHVRSVHFRGNASSRVQILLTRSHKHIHSRTLTDSFTYTHSYSGHKGHYKYNCPTIGNKEFDKVRLVKTTGIPKAFLKTVELASADTDQDALAGTLKQHGMMVTPSGEVVVAQVNEAAWHEAQQQARAQSSMITDLDGVYEEAVAAEQSGRAPPGSLISPQVQCSLCKGLAREAVRVSCCQAVFCDQCVRADMQAQAARGDGETVIKCPSCALASTIDNLIPDPVTRRLVDGQVRKIGEFLRKGVLPADQPDVADGDGATEGTAASGRPYRPWRPRPPRNRPYPHRPPFPHDGPPMHGMRPPPFDMRPPNFMPHGGPPPPFGFMPFPPGPHWRPPFFHPGGPGMLPPPPFARPPRYAVGGLSRCYAVLALTDTMSYPDPLTIASSSIMIAEKERGRGKVNVSTAMVRDRGKIVVMTVKARAVTDDVAILQHIVKSGQAMSEFVTATYMRIDETTVFHRALAMTVETIAVIEMSKVHGAIAQMTMRAVMHDAHVRIVEVIVVIVMEDALEMIARIEM